MLSSEEAIEKFKKFEKRADAKRTKQIDRIKEDRTFLGGKQWDKEDDAIYPTSRPRRTVNILSNSVNSTVNVYASYPFKWYSPDEETDSACNAFLKFGSNARAAYDVLYNNVAFGLGYFALGSESVMDADGTEVNVPALYSIEKVENIYFDPDSIEIDGHDAREASICEYRSKEWVRSKYGDKWVTEKGTRPIVNTTANKDPETMVIVTYFRMEGGRCSVYRLLNNDFLEEPVALNIDRVPVFPVYGERSYDDDDELIWQGLIRKGAPIQKLINYSFSQLGERMAMAPKPVFMTSGDAIENLDSGYKTFQYNSNPLLIYNRTTVDGKVALDPPQRLDNRVQFDDITNIIGAQLELLSTITGVDAKGIMQGETTQTTATEVLYNERQVQTSIRHFYANLRDTFKSVGETVMQLLNLGKRRIDVIAGPSEYMQLQIARQELMQLMGLVPEDKRMQFVNGIFMSHPDNAIMREVFGAINANPGPTQMEMQQQDVIEQMRTAIGEKDTKIQELMEQVKNYEQFQNNKDLDLKAEFIKKEMDHKFHQEDMILQARLDQGLDASRAEIENEKAQMELEKQAVQLDSTKFKAQADMVKTAMGIAAQQNKEVKNEDNARQ
jgi:hypothetical protein